MILETQRLIDDHNVDVKSLRIFTTPDLLWKAPEILRSNGKLKASQMGDVYAFAIVLHEIFGRMGPYGSMDIDPEGKELFRHRSAMTFI